MKNAVFLVVLPARNDEELWVLNGFERETHDEHVNFASKLSLKLGRHRPKKLHYRNWISSEIERFIFF